MDDQPRPRRLGLVGPDRVDRIAADGDQLGALVGQRLARLGHPVLGVQPGIVADPAAVGRMDLEPVGDAGLGHRLVAPVLAVDLVADLQRVAAVDEDRRFLAAAPPPSPPSPGSRSARRAAGRSCRHIRSYARRSAARRSRRAGRPSIARAARRGGLHRWTWFSSRLRRRRRQARDVAANIEPDRLGSSLRWRENPTVRGRHIGGSNDGCGRALQPAKDSADNRLRKDRMRTRIGHRSDAADYAWMRACRKMQRWSAALSSACEASRR